MEIENKINICRAISFDNKFLAVGLKSNDDKVN